MGREGERHRDRGKMEKELSVGEGKRELGVMGKGNRAAFLRPGLNPGLSDSRACFLSGMLSRGRSSCMGVTGG